MSYLMMKDPADLPQDKTVRCGWFITWTPPEFKDACKWHDEQYVLKHQGVQYLTRYEVDKLFYEKMSVAAGDSWRLQSIALFFYSLVKLLGGPIWKGKLLVKNGKLRLPSRGSGKV